MITNAYYYKNLPQLLKDLRGSADLTQEEAARGIHTSRIIISNLETGKTKFKDIDIINSYASFYNIDIMELLPLAIDHSTKLHTKIDSQLIEILNNKPQNKSALEAYYKAQFMSELEKYIDIGKK